MARFQVGEAFLQVVPSLTGLHKKIAAEVKSWRDLDVDVTPNMQRFREKVEAETSSLKDAQVNVEADTKGFREKVRAETTNLGDAHVNVKADVDTAGAKANVDRFSLELRETIAAAIKSLPKIDLDADSTRVNQKIQRIRAELASLQDASFSADFDDKGAIAKIKELEHELNALDHKRISVRADVDIAGATAKLAAFRAMAGGTDKDANIITRAMRAIGAPVGALVSGFGGLITRVGEWRGENTRLGGSLIGVGDSVTGLGANLTKLAAPIGSVVTFIGTASVGMSAMAGAASLAVAGAAQLGGAVVALGSGIVPLGSLIGALPGLIAPAAAAFGILKIAMGDAGVKKAVEDLKASFQPLVTDIQNQMRPAILGLIDTFKGFVPILRELAPQFTSALSDVMSNLSGVLASSSFKNDFRLLMTNAADNLKILGNAAVTTFKGLTDMAVAAQPAVNALTQYIGQLADRFAAWMAQARQSGELGTLMMQGVDALKSLVQVLINAGSAMKALWDSAQRTGAFQAVVDSLGNAFVRLRDYVSQVGGPWDQLMTRVTQIAPQIINLIGQIGDAFVQIGAKVDLGPVFDTISSLIAPLRDNIINIANAAVQLVSALGPVAKLLIECFGPSISEQIRVFADVIKGLTPAVQELGPAFSVIGAAVGGFIKILATGVVTIGGFLTAGVRLLKGDVSGAAQAFVDMKDTAKDIWGLLDKAGDSASGAATGFDGLKTSAGGAGTGVKELGTSLNGLPADKTVTLNADAAKAMMDVGNLNQSVAGLPKEQTITLNADAAGAITTAQQAQDAIKTVPQNWFTKFAGDVAGIAAAAGAAANSIGGVPLDHLTGFSGDTGNILAQAGAAQGAVAAVPLDKITQFVGDTGNILAAAGTATSGINAVPAAFLTTFLGDTGNILAQAAGAIAGINAVPPDHLTTLSGDNGNVLGAASGATGAINAIPGSHNTTLSAQDNASATINLVRAALSLIPASVTTVITAIQRTVTGGAAGYILEPMAAGAITMRPGGALNLQPMSGQVARIVPPNTWRVIGDRMQGAEAFIPLDRSLRSIAILAQAAQQMGYALAPAQLLPLIRSLMSIMQLAQGAVLATDDAGNPIAWGTAPDIPRSTPGARYPRNRRPPWRWPDWHRLFADLMRRLVIPAIQQAQGGQATTQTLQQAWQQQAATLADTVAQWYQGQQPLDQRPAWDHHRRGMPPGFDMTYATPAQIDAILSDQQWQFNAAGLDRPSPPSNVYNIYPRETQSEEAIAMMVARRQAFALRS